LAVGQHVDAGDQSGEEVSLTTAGGPLVMVCWRVAAMSFEVVARGRGWRPVERSRDLAAV
jgi:hypothetical protein